MVRRWLGSLGRPFGSLRRSVARSAGWSSARSAAHRVGRALRPAVVASQAHLGALRRRSDRVDHLLRAAGRYSDVRGGRLAAASAYYGFFAAFALAVLLFAVLGALLGDNKAVTHAVEGYLRRNLPGLTVATLLETSRHVGWFAAAGLAFAGVSWVTSLRASLRAVWGLDGSPGHLAIRRLIDIAVLVGLGAALIGSVSVSAGLQRVLLRLVHQADFPVLRALLGPAGVLLAGLVDLVLAAALLAWVPRLRLPRRRLVPAALVVAVGLWLLKTLGGWYIARLAHNPAYQVVAGAVGLLLFMYLFHQLVLFAAALAATSREGTVLDLAAGRVRPAEPAPQPASVEPAPPPAGPAGPARADRRRRGRAVRNQSQNARTVIHRKIGQKASGAR